ncbi:MAG: hypothetical protein KIT62_05240 [Cyclobacteriaceae bacterium]|nr:hypothetical protein [Cyclobacteriaceae bacterium]
MTWSIKPVAVYYEHPAWFEPLLAKLEKRRLPFVRLNAAQHLRFPVLAKMHQKLPYNHDFEQNFLDTG